MSPISLLVCLSFIGVVQSDIYIRFCIINDYTVYTHFGKNFSIIGQQNREIARLLDESLNITLPQHGRFRFSLTCRHVETKSQNQESFTYNDFDNFQNSTHRTYSLLNEVQFFLYLSMLKFDGFLGKAKVGEIGSTERNFAIISLNSFQLPEQKQALVKVIAHEVSHLFGARDTDVGEYLMNNNSKSFELSYEDIENITQNLEEKNGSNDGLPFDKLSSPPKPLPKCGADFLDKIPLCPCNNDKPTHECFPLDEPNCARNCKHIIQCPIGFLVDRKVYIKHNLSETSFNNLTINMSHQFDHQHVNYTLCPKKIDIHQIHKELEDQNFCIFYLVTNDEEYSRKKKIYYSYEKPVITSILSDQQNFEQICQQELNNNQKIFKNVNLTSKNYPKCPSFVNIPQALNTVTPTTIDVVTEAIPKDETSGQDDIILLSIVAFFVVVVFVCLAIIGYFKYPRIKAFCSRFTNVNANNNILAQYNEETSSMLPNANPTQDTEMKEFTNKSFHTTLAKKRNSPTNSKETDNLTSVNIK